MFNAKPNPHMNASFTCPHCHQPLNLESAIASQVESRLAETHAAQQAELATRQADLDARAARLQQQDADWQRELQVRLDAQMQQLRPELLKQAETEQAARVKTMQDELARQSGRIKQMQAQELELQRQKRELEEQREAIGLAVEKQLQQERAEMKAAALQRAREEQELKLAEKEGLIQNLSEQLTGMTRRLEQGSQQMQGEVQELALERLLAAMFPFDQVQEVGKGQNGADIIHTIRNEYGKVCGRIIYESKRTKAFSPAWIEKIKADQQRHKGDMVVLVTETMPKEMLHAGLYKGVWICTFREAKAMVQALRETVVRVAQAQTHAAHATDKKHLLYQYFNSPEFGQCIESIVRGFSCLKDGLEREKRAMLKQWAEREKQIEMVTGSTLCLAGSIQGIAGRDVVGLPELERMETEIPLLP